MSRPVPSRPIGRTRHARVLSEGPDPDLLHRLGRACNSEPYLLYRARRDPSSSGQDLSLDQIVTAQQEFLKKSHVGNFVLIPPLV